MKLSITKFIINNILIFVISLLSIYLSLVLIKIFNIHVFWFFAVAPFINMLLSSAMKNEIIDTNI